MKKGIIISALGSGSFAHEQVERLQACLDVTFHARLGLMTREEFVRLAEPAEILAVTRRSIKNLDAESLQLLPNLQALAIYSTGYEWVDVEHLRQRGIAIAYLPEYSTVAVAEHTLGLMLSMSRRIHLAFDKVRGYVPEGISLRGFELRGKTLGLVGLGRIGREVAKMAAAFGMKIYYYDEAVELANNRRTVEIHGAENDDAKTDGAETSAAGTVGAKTGTVEANLAITNVPSKHELEASGGEFAFESIEERVSGIIAGAAAVGVEYLPFRELLPRADYLVLVCSKKRHAPPVIGETELALLKPSTYLINTARADLVNAQAVVAAIKEKRLEGYAVDDAIDVFLNDPEIQPGRILQTGHSAWYSTEAIQRGTEEWVENIVALATGEPRNLVFKAR